MTYRRVFSKSRYILGRIPGQPYQTHLIRQRALKNSSRVLQPLDIIFEQAAHSLDALLPLVIGWPHQQVVAMRFQELDGVPQEGQEIFRKHLGPADVLEEGDDCRGGKSEGSPQSKFKKIRFLV